MTERILGWFARTVFGWVILVFVGVLFLVFGAFFAAIWLYTMATIAFGADPPDHNLVADLAQAISNLVLGEIALALAYYKRAEEMADV